MRGFEKISYEQFRKDIKDDESLYESYALPKRSTVNSAGYDFYLLEDVILKQSEIYKTPTGIKARMQENEVMFIIIRSSLGYKKSVILPNQVGVIDSDYYNNINNEGHIFIPIKNDSLEEVTLKKGEAFAQGIFTNYLVVSDEVEIKQTRNGGFGSTNGGN